MSEYIAGQLLTQTPATLPVIVGLCIAIYYRRLSRWLRLMICGFALITLLHVSASIIQLYLANRFLLSPNVTPSIIATYSRISLASSMIFLWLNTCAWIPLLAGLALTLRDLQTRLWAREDV